MFARKFEMNSMAHTLSADEVCEGHGSLTGWSTRTHADGWTISGVIAEDYFYWVNAFEASHPRYGRVWGDFEEEVYADSQEAFDAFYAEHTPEFWDYQDICPRGAVRQPRCPSFHAAHLVGCFFLRRKKEVVCCGSLEPKTYKAMR